MTGLALTVSVLMLAVIVGAVIPAKGEERKVNMLKTLVRKTISLLPRSRIIDACCRYYSELYSGSVGCASHDRAICTNGEGRLLQELAPHLHTVFDVGAHVGSWTDLVFSLAPDSRIHAFEPSPSSCAAFTRRSFPGSVSLHRFALSSESGTACLHVFGEESTLNSLHNRRGLEDGWGITPAARSESVPVETVDAFCMRSDLRCVDYMKVDTEGHEVDVLHGSRRSLAAGVIRRVQVEYGGAYIDSRRLLRDVFDVFADIDYDLFLIVPHGLMFCPRYDQRMEDFRYRNFVAFHRDTVSDTPCAKAARGRMPGQAETVGRSEA